MKKDEIIQLMDDLELELEELEDEIGNMQDRQNSIEIELEDLGARLSDIPSSDDIDVFMTINEEETYLRSFKKNDFTEELLKTLKGE